MSAPSGAPEADPLRRWAREAPSAIALEGGGLRWSFEELDRVTDRTAERLASGGVGPGDRVGLLLEMSPDAVILLLAIARRGAVAAPLSPGLTPPEVAEALEAIAPVRTVDRGEAAALVEGEGGDGHLVGRPTRSRWPDSGAPRAVLWTSGTSGRARGVVLTEGNLAASAGASRERLGLGPGDRWCASLSVAHVGGLALVDRALRTGAALVAEGPFEAERLARLLREGRVTHASLVPVMLRRLLDRWGDERAPEGLRLLLLGGDRTPEPLMGRALESSWPVALTYGMTETSSQVATAPPERVRRKPGTVGRPLPGVEVRIAPQGEIRVRGPTVARSYLGGGSLALDEEGWLRTGDRGRRDGEGDLWVTGRLSERIVSGGVTVDPGEVVRALRSLPQVADAAVVGLTDPEWGERVVAAVVPAPGAPGVELGGSGGAAEGGGGPLPRWLDEPLRKRLGGAKRPRAVVFVDHLPRNPTGKVDPEAVRALFEEASSPGGRGEGAGSGGGRVP